MDAAPSQTGSSLDCFAASLRDAEANRTPIPPLTESDPGLTLADGYGIQSRNIDVRVKAGRVVRGRKVGLTNTAIQQQLGVNEPDFGVLLDDMFVEDGDSVAVIQLISPRVESEIAFVMERDLTGPGVTSTGALRAVAGAVPAIEIVDSRIADWKIKLVDTVADNASAARVVLGSRITPVAGIDLRVTGMFFSRNGTIAEVSAGAAVLGHPARCVAWLANKLAEFGAGLRAGDVIMAGAVHRMIPVVAGDLIVAEFDHLGSVTTRFVGNAADSQGS